MSVCLSVEICDMGFLPAGYLCAMQPIVYQNTAHSGDSL